MATMQQCSKCNKSLGACYCTGCKAYFCFKDFLGHRNQLKNEIDMVYEDCISLQGKMITPDEHNEHESPVLAAIDEWEKMAMEKVKRVAELARKQVATILTNKRTEIPKEFKKITEELNRRREAEDFVENDLLRLKQKLRQLDQNLKELTYPASIVLNTASSDITIWDHLIHVQDNFTKSMIEEQPPPLPDIMHYSYVVESFFTLTLRRQFRSYNRR